MAGLLARSLPRWPAAVALRREKEGRTTALLGSRPRRGPIRSARGNGLGRGGSPSTLWSVLQLVRALLDQYPGAASAVTSEGLYADPLLDDQLVRFLVERDPAAVRRAASAEGMQLPVHDAIRHAHSLEAVEQLVQECPESLHVTAGGRWGVRPAPGRTSRSALSAARSIPCLHEPGPAVDHRRQRSNPSAPRHAAEPQDDGHGSDLGGAAAPGAHREGLRAAAAEATVELVELLIRTRPNPSSINVRDATGSLPRWHQRHPPPRSIVHSIRSIPDSPCLLFSVVSLEHAYSLAGNSDPGP
jgi:hypothetical protein